jgi:hypothetical protein
MFVNKLIVHYVNADKFTSGYIFFMQNHMIDYEHVFITEDSAEIGNNVVDAEIIFISKGFEILFCKRIRGLLGKCEKFIVSGLFGIELYLIFLPKRFFEKMYLHFWGGDFYYLRKQVNLRYLREEGARSYLVRGALSYSKKTCIRKCYAILNLIDEDYDELIELSGVEVKKHFTAPMPGEGAFRIEIPKIEFLEKSTSPIFIQIGNSASQSNHHMEALKLLERFSGEDMRIICPLSYGPGDNASQVISFGKYLFGYKFIPLTKFSSYNDYLRILANIKVALFNNDRQQALGNINPLLRMGSKVYLRHGTSMWKRFIRSGYIIYDISSIESMSYKEFLSFDKHSAENNRAVHIRCSDLSTLINQWKIVLDD